MLNVVMLNTMSLFLLQFYCGIIDKNYVSETHAT